MHLPAPEQFLSPSPQKQAADLIAIVLKNHGFQALYAGGWVRDLLMNRPGEDIDIATDAPPETLLALFPDAIHVGIAFGVIRLVRKGIQFEVATFRKDGNYLDGRHPANIHITLSSEEDALRRDFTINGLFYDPFTHIIYDYVHGIEDLRDRIIRTIGNPFDRFSEDRLRVIRAIRFKNSLSYTMDSQTWNAICDVAQDTFPRLSPERIWQELDKMHLKGVLALCLEDMHKSGLLSELFSFIPTMPPEELTQRFQAIQRVSHPIQKEEKTTVLAIALIFPSSQLELRDQLAERFHLSNEEKKSLITFSQIETALHQGISTYTERNLVSLLSLPYAKQALYHLETLSPSFQRDVKILQSLYMPLSFWIDQLAQRKFHITGQDFLNHGIKPGKAIGALVEKAFALSLSLKEKNKHAVIDYILKEENVQNESEL